MKKHEGGLIFPVSDLVNFLSCRPLIALDLVSQSTRLPQAKDDPTSKLLQEKGFAHESAFLEKLIKEGRQVVKIPDTGTLEERVRLTNEAIHKGADVIFQAAFLQPPWFGYADFLIKGESGYEVYDTKLSGQVRAKFLVQLGFYNQLLAGVQGHLGRRVHVVLGDGTVVPFIATELDGYLSMVKERFLTYAASLKDLKDPPYPIPCEKCPTCRWRDLCAEKRLKDDHLSQVAGMRKSQIAKLEAAGIATMAKLAALHAKPIRIPKLESAILAKLAHQAHLQQGEKTSGKQAFALLEPNGLACLPPPDPGDLFFDMEGNPLEKGGLEYLFGVAYEEKKKPAFTSFWAHSRAEERVAFTAFIEFVRARLRAFPDAHIYHYAPYEVSAMRRLAGRHGTREDVVDALLRDERFVDLYAVVRDSLIISKDSYSIKKVEAFYREKRKGEVKQAAESIVVYEEWKVTKDPALLQSIEDYNKEDCVSTLQLRDWLLKIAPQTQTALPQDEEPPRLRSAKSLQDEAERTSLEEKLLPYALGQKKSPLAPPEVFALIAQLLAFHVREKKPLWWSLFDRQGAELEDLLEDEEILAGCQADSTVDEGSGMVVRFRFPEQVFRLKVGDTVKLLATPLQGGELTAIDAAKRSVTVHFKKQVELEAQNHLVQHADIPTTALGKAISRFAQSLLSGEPKYKALLHYLKRERELLYIQGPPGTGKTYTGAQRIAQLVQAGKKVAVCSNSHKAVNHLMGAAHDLLKKAKFPHQAMKKVSREEHNSDRPGIENMEDDKKIIAALPKLSLVGGVVFSFCKEGYDQAFDYLFVDEAGQVSLANLIAIGLCAKHIVLLGDQMQLGQPILAAHPGRSGDSSLDYLLDGHATIPEGRGLFLAKTFRMHPELTRFVSDCFYEGRLLPDDRTKNQKLVLEKNHHPALKAAGLVLREVPHLGNAQRSEEEAKEVKTLLESLLKQRFVDHQGKEHAMTLDEVLIVAPYNAQVELLKRSLPEGARVGTVDKFQGQEAQAVIVSMASSSTSDCPRGMEFLLDRNRLNVAVSRAKCLAILVCSPGLLESQARTPEDVARLNVLGRAKIGF